MIKKAILLFIFYILLPSTIYAAPECQITTYDKIFHLNNPDSISINDLITNSNCPLNIKKTFKNIIFKFKGALRSSYIQTAFKEEFLPYTVTISPSVINIAQLGNYLASRLELKQNFKLTNLRFLDNRKLLLLTDKESLRVKCQKCKLTGEKNIELTIANPISGMTNATWLNGTVAILTKVLISKSNQRVDSQGLNATHFKFSHTYTPTPEKYFSSIDKISYFKLNTPIHADRALKISDLTALNLVKPGIPATIVLKSNSISLASKALPMNHGKFGDTIHLRNLKTNRSIIGKVIDFNKVLIEL